MEQQRNNKEITKREQRKEIDGSNHEFENFENIYIYCKTKLELSRYRYFSWNNQYQTIYIYTIQIYRISWFFSYWKLNTEFFMLNLYLNLI